jgi:hypothetical protein
MSGPHESLKDGMVLLTGIDPRRNDFCYYTFNGERLKDGKRSICFEEMVPVFEKLGFEVEPHWTEHGRKRGWYAIKGVRHHVHESFSFTMPKVDPIVEKILTDSVNNKGFKDLLSMENE